MGFGGIIATGITVILLIVAGYIIIAGLSYGVDSANAAQAAIRDSAEGRMRTSLAISGFEQVDAFAWQFDVTNDGETPIADVTGLDVFVKPVGNGLVSSCRYLPFRDEAGHGAPDHWYVVGQVGTGVEGTYMLEPGDTMTVQCEFTDGVPAQPVGYIEVAAPNGVQAYLSYNY